MSQKVEKLEKERNQLKAAKENNERVHKNATTKLRNTIEKFEKENSEVKNSNEKMVEDRKLDKKTRQKLEEKIRKLGQDCTDLRVAKNELAKESKGETEMFNWIARQSEIQINKLHRQNDKITKAAKELRQEYAENREKADKEIKWLKETKDQIVENSEKEISELKTKIENDEKTHDSFSQKLEVDFRKLELVTLDLKIQLDDNVKISEKEINELKDNIKEKTEKDEIDKTVSQWVLENNPVGKNGETMLHSAAKNGNVKLCEMILDNLEDNVKL